MKYKFILFIILGLFVYFIQSQEKIVQEKLFFGKEPSKEPAWKIPSGGKNYIFPAAAFCDKFSFYRLQEPNLKGGILKLCLSWGSPAFVSSFQQTPPPKDTAWELGQWTPLECKIEILSGSQTYPFIPFSTRQIFETGKAQEVSFYLSEDIAKICQSLITANSFSPSMSAKFVMDGKEYIVETKLPEKIFVEVKEEKKPSSLRVLKPIGFSTSEDMPLYFIWSPNKAAQRQHILRGKEPLEITENMTYLEYSVAFSTNQDFVNTVQGEFTQWSQGQSELVLPIQMKTVDIDPKIFEEKDKKEEKDKGKEAQIKKVVMVLVDSDCLFRVAYFVQKESYRQHILLREGGTIQRGIALCFDQDNTLKDVYDMSSADFGVSPLTIHRLGEKANLVEFALEMAKKRLQLLLNPTKSWRTPAELIAQFGRKILEDVLPQYADSTSVKISDIVSWYRKYNELDLKKLRKEYPSFSAACRLCSQDEVFKWSQELDNISKFLAEKKPEVEILRETVLQHAEYTSGPHTQKEHDLLIANRHLLSDEMRQRLWEKLPVLKVPEYMPLTKALQCRRSNQRIEIAKGNHVVETTIVLSRNLTIVGDGVQTTQIVLAKDSYLESKNASLEIKGITIDRESGFEGKAAGIILNNSKGVLEDCAITDHSKGIVAQLSSSLTLRNVSIQKNAVNGLEIQEGGDIRITKCKIADNGETGIVIKGTQKSLILEDCVITGHSLSGIHIAERAKVELQSSEIAANLQHGIFVSGEGASLTLKKCTVQNNQWAGIYVQKMASARIEESTCQSNQTSGIVLAENSNANILKNIILQNRGHGIHVKNSSCEAKENAFQENTENGIFLESSQGCLTLNTCTKNKKNGIEIRDESNPIVEINDCSQNGQHGVLLAKCSGTLLKNRCCENGMSGILATENPRKTLISQNACHYNHEDGIGIAACFTDMVLATKNVTLSNRKRGISVTKSLATLAYNQSLQNLWADIDTQWAEMEVRMYENTTTPPGITSPVFAKYGEPEMVCQLGHTGTVYSVAFSPNKTMLASGAGDEVVRLWHVPTQKLLRILKGHTAPVRSVAFSADSKLVASGGEDNSVRVWEAATGRLIYKLEAHTRKVLSVAFSPDGTLLASASDDKTVRLWDEDTGSLVCVLEDFTSFVNSVAFSPDSKILATAGGADVKMFDIASRKVIVTLESAPSYAVAFSGDGKILASAKIDGTIKLWNVAMPGKLLGTILSNTASKTVYSVAFQPDGNLLATAASNETSLVDKTWGLLAMIREPKDTESPVYSVAFSADGKLLATCYETSVRIWDVATSSPIYTIGGHSSNVYAIAFSPDGKLMASGGNDKTIKLWNASTGSLLATWGSGHVNGVRCLAFSPDSRFVASGGLVANANTDNPVKVWDVATGGLVYNISGHTHHVYAITFSPDGKWIATTSHDNTLRLWDMSTGSQKASFSHPNAVYSVAFSPDSKTIATGCVDKNLYLWDISDSSKPKTTITHPNVVDGVMFSPDGKLVASGCADNLLRLWDVTNLVTTSNPVVICSGHTGTVFCLRFSPDGKTIASGGADKTVRVWNTKTGNVLYNLNDHTAYIQAVAFTPDGKTLASGGDDNTIRLWDMATGKPSRVIADCTNVYCARWSRDTKMIAAGCGDKTIKIYDASTKAWVQTLTGHSGNVLCVDFSPDGKMLASSTDSGDKTIKLWEMPSGKLLKTLPVPGHTDNVFAVSFSPDGRILATGSHDKTVRLWDVATGNLIRPPLGHNGIIYSLSFTPDGKILASACTDNTIRLWDVATGNPAISNKPALTGHTKEVYCVVFSPDGKTLASGSNDNNIQLWETATGNPLGKPMSGHTGYVWGLAFSPDGKILASGGNDKTIRVWDVATGKTLRSLYIHTNLVRSLAFHPDGKTLLTSSDDGTICFWDVSTGGVCKSMDGTPNTLHPIALGVGNAPTSLLATESGTTLPIAPSYSRLTGRHKLVSGLSDGCIRAWDISPGNLCRISQTFQGHTGMVLQSVSLDPNGKRLVSASSDPNPIVWDMETGKPAFKLAEHTQDVSGVVFSPDGKYIATSSMDKKTRLYEAETGKMVRTLEVHAESVLCLAFSPDSKTLVTGSKDATIQLWDVVTGNNLAALKDHKGSIYCLSFAADGKSLVSCGEDKCVRVWDVESRKLVASLYGHNDVVYCLALHKDGKTLASGGADNRILLWDLSAGKILATYTHSHDVRSLAFSKDGDILVSASADRETKLWRILADTPDWQNKLRLMVTLIPFGINDFVTISPEGWADWSDACRSRLHFSKESDIYSDKSSFSRCHQE